MFYENFENNNRGPTTKVLGTVPAITTESNNNKTTAGITMPPTRNNSSKTELSREEELEQTIAKLQARISKLESDYSMNDEKEEHDIDDFDKEEEKEERDEHDMDENENEEEEEEENEENEENEEKNEGFKNKKHNKGKKVRKTEGFHNRNLGFGIFTNNFARNILRTALIVLFIVMIQDKYVKDAVMKSVKNSNLVSKNIRDATPLIMISVVVFIVISFL